MEQNGISEGRGGGEGLEEISPRTYVRICRAHGHRQQSGEGPVGGWGLRGGGQSEGNGGHL